jgi:protoheme IX farnesyltransferase
MIVKTETYSLKTHFMLKARACFELLKIRLSLLVSFSSAFGYLMADNGKINWFSFLMFIIGGFLISGSALTINQWLEKESDKKMVRTRNRPIPTERISISEAMIFSTITFSAGIVLLAAFANVLAAILSAVSLILYAFIYTPMKRVGPVAVLIGAIPGALPPLLGWVAATGSITPGALILFLIQFIWQFPHFWAIAWLADEDYKNAGFRLLPGIGQKDRLTGYWIMVITLALIPAGFLPFGAGISGLFSAVVIASAGICFFIITTQLARSKSRTAALKIMYSSFIYLPLVQIALLLDKI